MAATPHPASTSLSIPATQNTAPVICFSCLYTHDLRRKQKRWQDGVLKFHTFNKRIVVYDVPRNFVGDTHWREPQALQDGDELELEKGVLIQVGEQVEKTETDLSELLQKRTPKAAPLSERAASTLGTRTAEPMVHIRDQVNTPRSRLQARDQTPFAQLRPKSLNALLGTLRGPPGKAVVPVRSPAELRREKENGHPIERSPKRRRIEYPTTASPTTQTAEVRTAPVAQPTQRVTTSDAALDGAQGKQSKRQYATGEVSPKSLQPEKTRDISRQKHGVQQRSKRNQRTDDDALQETGVLDASEPIRESVKAEKSRKSTDKTKSV